MQVSIANHDHTIIWDGIYNFALSDYPRITPWELKKLLTFIDYEKRHGRETEIQCKDEGILTAVRYAIAHPETVAHASLPEKITECTACKQKGCLTKFLCHTATVENAARIFASGRLLSAVKAFDKAADELVLDKRNAAGDPADYFDYIMFSWGNCGAGDILTMERNLGRSPTNDECENNLSPGVRFYFHYKDIINHPGYIFDGYHPAKIKDELVLADYLHLCIVPSRYKNELEGCVRAEIADKIYYLPQDGLGIWDWAKKAYDFACAWRP